MAQLSFKVFGRLEVIGALPAQEPCIIAANHLSFNDPGALVASISRRLHFISKRDFTHIALLDWIIEVALKTVGVCTFDRSGIGLDALRQGRKWLKQNCVVAIFPEGTRSRRTHQLQKALPGIISLAVSSGALIVPIGISGTEKFPAWRMLLPLHRVRVNIGEPFKLPEIEGRLTPEKLRFLVNIVMFKIAKQLPEEYRGIYGEE